MKSYLENHGGNLKNSISSKVDFLIAGQNPGSKLNIAKKLGVKIMIEVEFSNYMEKINND